MYWNKICLLFQVTSDLALLSLITTNRGKRFIAAASEKFDKKNMSVCELDGLNILEPGKKY